MKRSMKLGIAILASTSVALWPFLPRPAQSQSGATEAPAGFDSQTNGYVGQGAFDLFQDAFSETEGIDEGLGPVFNNTGCLNCHNNPVAGGSSEIFETRAGTLDGPNHFTEHPGGSVVQDQAIPDAPIEQVLPGEVFTHRASVSVLGDGFVEAISDDKLIGISNSQPSTIRGLVIYVPVLEANGATRVGRFGWKNQHASLDSFAADAYLNEMGITSPLQPDENTSDGNSVAQYDTVRDPEDSGGADVRKFADFMRATKVPPRDVALANDPGAKAGEQLFNSLGCGGCHVQTIITAPAGTGINGGTLTVRPALANKIIHPFSDFLLHNIGTNDPIVQNGGQATLGMVRTAPLWGLRTRSKFLHDLSAPTLTDAINAHGGQAATAAAAFNALSPANKTRVLTFLDSL